MGTSRNVTVTYRNGSGKKQTITRKREKRVTRAERARTGEVGMGVQGESGVIAGRGRIPVLRDRNGNIDFNAMRERTATIQQRENQPKKKSKKK